MNITDAAHSYLRSQLEEIVNSGNLAALQALLQGIGLPAMGEEYEPAERIMRALESDQRYAVQGERLAQLLASLVHQSAEQCDRRITALSANMVSDGGIVAAYPGNERFLDDERYICNLFLLASRLQRHPDLFDGLHRFYEIGLKTHVLLRCHNRAALHLRDALSEQQHDRTLEGYWLGLLHPNKLGWDAPRRGELLDAWRGVLNLCDLDADLDGSLLLINKGLRLLHNAVAERPESIDVLKLAFWRIETSLPLDPATWAAYLAPHFAEWPELLRDVAVTVWPDLERTEEQEETQPLRDELLPLWQALKEEDRVKLSAYYDSGAGNEAEKYIKKTLLFKPPIISGIPPQNVRGLLNKLAGFFCPRDSSTKQTVQPDNPAADEHRTQHAPRRRGRVSFDRLAALQAINNTLETIEQKLRQRDEATARRYLNELVDQQRQQPIDDTNLHIAKTLAKAATIARDLGFLPWAEELLNDACRENPDDEVAASGLADVLKTQGRLDEAEAAYRSNMLRWPNDDVAASGLADVLKTQWRLEEAEAAYRSNMLRWPNDVVAASGLADVLKTRGLLEEAEAAYRSNMLRWPNDEVAANGLADVLKAQGRLDEAEAAYRSNMVRWPKSRIIINGLANVLRKQKRHVEALRLLPTFEGGVVIVQDSLRDLHLRAMILSDFGRFDDARNAFMKGLEGARNEVSQRYFREGLAVLEIRAGRFESAGELLKSLPSNVVPLNLYRLHVAAALNRDSDDAASLWSGLTERTASMTYLERQTLILVEKSFCLHEHPAICHPSQADLEELYEAEIELALAV